MKVVDVIKELQELVDENGNDLNVDFKIFAPKYVCDDDSMDIDINYEGAIDTSDLDEGEVGIGFKVHKEYEKHFWEQIEESNTRAYHQASTCKKSSDFKKEDLDDMEYIEDHTLVSVFDIRDALNTDGLGLSFKQKQSIFYILNEWKEEEINILNEERANA